MNSESKNMATVTASRSQQDGVLRRKSGLRLACVREISAGLSAREVIANR
jgi:hypothetical protein